MKTTKFLKSILSAIVICIAGSSLAAPSSTSAFMTDLQTEYNRDETYDTFSFVSMVSCLIRSMAPEQKVNAGPYLVYVDDNKCEDSSTSSSSSSTGSMSAAPQYSRGITTVTVDSSTNKMTVVSKFKAMGDSDGVKHYLIKAVITSGPGVTPPYGVWDMDYCGSTVGNENSTCDRGKGFVRVNASSLGVYNVDSGNSGSRAGSAIFETTTSGYGVMQQTGTKNGVTATLDTKFTYAPEKYLRQTVLNNGTPANTCLNPKISDPGTLFSVWETYLYNKDTGAKIEYTNQGFPIRSTQAGNSGRTIGYANYWGTNWWDEATAADKATGAVITGTLNNTETRFQVNTAPGRLEKVKTSQVKMADIDQVVFKMGFWGAEKDIIDNSIQPPNFTTASGSWYSLLGYWDNTAQKFKFSAIQTCSSNCSMTSLDGAAKTEFTLSEVIALGANGFGGWIDGSGINYSAGITQWVNNVNVAKSLTDIKITKETREIVKPNELANNAQLICVNNCYNSSKIQTSINWPYKQSDITTYAWNQTLGAPTISNVAIEFSNITPAKGHWMRLYDSGKLSDMACNYWNGTAMVSGGICDWQYTQSDGATYYNWSTGNTWDAYSYLTYESTGEPYKFDPPVTLTYNVPALADLPPGVDKGYAGKKIQIQSPGAGELWLPGHCVNKTDYTYAECGSDTDWVQDLYIKFDAADISKSLVTLNDNTTGQETSTQYYAKWLKRGVMFAIKDANTYCAGMSLSKSTSMTIPSLSNWSNPYIGNTWGVTDADFNATPKVIDGVVQ
jgi:hypothetical protein